MFCTKVFITKLNECVLIALPYNPLQSSTVFHTSTDPLNFSETTYIQFIFRFDWQNKTSFPWEQSCCCSQETNANNYVHTRPPASFFFDCDTGYFSISPLKRINERKQNFYKNTSTHTHTMVEAGIFPLRSSFITAAHLSCPTFFLFAPRRDRDRNVREGQMQWQTKREKLVGR